MIEIISYTKEYKDYIKIFNYEWLNKFFSVEPLDEIQLSNPQEEIIDKGGHIFYATFHNVIAGTATLIRKDAHTYELGKMAITENYQGKGIANILMDHCIDFARSLNAQKLILYSNTKLIPAIKLYKKYGFIEVPMNDSHYIRSDIKMEKVL